MFTVYHSNHVDLLKSLLLALAERDPLSNPFQQEIILVQSPGMAQWLKLEIAKETGIAANIAFPLPATFIWEMFTRVLADVPERSYFNKEAMGWKLMKLLPECLQDEDFSQLAQYLEGDEGGQKRFQLAGKVADVLDQYLVYRPEWIEAWEQGQPVSELDGSMPWQPKVWRQLYDYTLGLGQSPYHRANLYQQFIDTLEGMAGKPEGLKDIDRIFVFGISALPPRYLDALKALGQHVDVHYMFTNPCKFYWGDVRDRRYLAKRANMQQSKVLRVGEDAPAGGQLGLLFADDENNAAEVGNSLLASMGKLGRDNLYLLSELECQEVDAGFVDINRDSLLHHLQADILNLQEAGDPKSVDSTKKTPVKGEDHSLTIQVCHSPMREVEVLHDRLLGMMAADATLKPRDIVVMVADINAYSPSIQAVFGNAPGERFVPYSISDRTADQESPLLKAFLHLLTLPESRCTAAELLSLLEVPAVSRRFELDAAQFDRVKLWVEEAGVRWGLNDDTAPAFALPTQHENTWLFGLQRMLLGYAMPLEAGLFNDIAPYDEVQGLDAQLAGQLAAFVDTLLAYRKKLSVESTGEVWSNLLTGMIDDFFAVEQDEEPAARLIRDKLERWQQQLQDAGFDAPLSLAVARDYLNDQLGGETVSQRFLAGQVNFCTLMPMRSIPFRVVCLLGMNDGVYPRTVAPVGFDLMVGRTRAGDRSRRDDDRYLFLEAMLAAQEVLYISYVGRSIQDNSEKVPSVLVSELLEYASQGYCLIGDEGLPSAESSANLVKSLTYAHPLVPFSPDAFRGEMPSFAREWLPAARGEGEAVPPFMSGPLDENWLEPVDGLLTVELAELQRFWRLPVQYFFNRRLKIWFEGQADALDDFEPFALDNLDRFRLRQSLLETMLENDSSDGTVECFFRQQKAQGLLPHSQFGALALNEEVGAVLPLYQHILPWISESRDDREVNLSFTLGERKVQLLGWVGNQYANGHVVYRAGNAGAKEQLAVWINHLCLCAGGFTGQSLCIGTDAGWLFNPVDPDKAKSWLSIYLEGYFAGLQQPLPFLPRSANAGLSAQFSRGGQFEPSEKANDKIVQAFMGGFMTSGDVENAYVARVWPNIDDTLLDQVYISATNYLLPVLEAREKLEDKD